MSRLEGVKLFISSPCHTGMVPTQFMVGIIEMMHFVRTEGGRTTIDMITGESLVTRARNIQLYKFLTSSCTHLLIWDTDQAMRPSNALVDLINLDLDFVGIPVPLKETDWKRVQAAALMGADYRRLQSAGLNYAFIEKPGGTEVVNSLFEVSNIGTGCMLLKREAVERMVDAYPERWFYTGSNKLLPGKCVPLLFDHMVDESRLYLSEDYSFCELWKAIGGKIYAWVGADVSHIGQCDYRSDFDLWLMENANRVDLT